MVKFGHGGGKWPKNAIYGQSRGNGSCMDYILYRVIVVEKLSQQSVKLYII